ncbi:MAG TPA: serine hydrolase, partial [Thermoleophilia bacterium]|nr:serine hydrolase [Thermoleophilia bacterium]
MMKPPLHTDQPRPSARKRRRRLHATILIAALALFLATGLSLWRAYGVGAPAAPDYWPTTGWQTAAPEMEGIDSVKLAESLLAIREKGTKIHSLLIIRRGHVVLDAYFYPYDGSTYHDLASVTKSFTTTLIGIAADQEKLRLDQSVLAFFGDRSVANRDVLKEEITVRDLASMSSGLFCRARPREVTLEEMRKSPDYAQFVLDRKVITEPGSSFNYSSPGMHLLSATLQEAT